MINLDDEYFNEAWEKVKSALEQFFQVQISDREKVVQNIQRNLINRIALEHFFKAQMTSKLCALLHTV